ncbi:cell wall elongation regulator TseB-like domain-containing protein [Listeria kieliensis]
MFSILLPNVRQFEERNERNMLRTRKKRRVLPIILILLAVVIVLFLAGIWFLSYSEKPLKKEEATALSRIEGNVDLKKQDQFYLYNGTKETYYVLTGENKAGKKIIVWVPKKKSGEILVKYASDGISEKKAREIVKAKKNPAKILKVTLGMEEGIPLWEVSYLDKDDRLGYYDMSFSEGKWLRQIENL